MHKIPIDRKRICGLQRVRIREKVAGLNSLNSADQSGVKLPPDYLKLQASTPESCHGKSRGLSSIIHSERVRGC
jgi:hypothetical protein